MVTVSLIAAAIVLAASIIILHSAVRDWLDEQARNREVDSEIRAILKRQDPNRW